MKKCLGCGDEKPLGDFSPERRVLDGRKSRCKACLALQARGREGYFREHYRKNREKRLAWMRDNYDRAAWQRQRRANGRARLDDAMGMQLYFALRHGKKRRTWETIVGYDVNDLIGHLSARFKAGMSLENYGEWHVDHIRPKASFSYQSEHDEDFRKCWALENLQPLWAEENYKKGARCA